MIQTLDLMCYSFDFMIQLPHQISDHIFGLVFALICGLLHELELLVLSPHQGERCTFLGKIILRITN